MKSHKELLPLLEKAKDKLKKSEVIQELCKEFGVDTSILDYIPMAFTDLDVSARTDKGCIYFNYKLIDNFLEDHLHYAAHELQHHFDQCYGDGPTVGAAEGEYLDNKFEQEGFKTQTEYISETEGDDEAEKYIHKVFDHHDVPLKERKEKIKKLLEDFEG